jgi:hypothetical protein
MKASTSGDREQRAASGRSASPDVTLSAFKQTHAAYVRAARAAEQGAVQGVIWVDGD